MARAKNTSQGDLFAAPPAAEANPARGNKAGAKASPAASERHRPGAGFGRVMLVLVPTDTGPLTYGVPPEFSALQPGCRVTVPLRRKLVVGVAWGWLDAENLGFSPSKLRPIDSVLDDQPLLGDAQRATVEFVARYYHSTLGMALRTALAAPLRRTGIGVDIAPAQLVWWAGVVQGALWPTDLGVAKKRVLERLLASGDTEISALRRAPGGDGDGDRPRRVSIPQRLLTQLADAGLIRLWQERKLRDPLGLRDVVQPDLPPLATSEQSAAVRTIKAALAERRYETFLLRGVTGSGKTEVYMRVIASVLKHHGAQNRQDNKGGQSIEDSQDATEPTNTGAIEPGGAIVLVPEIALTPQLVHRFRCRFGDRVAVLHSALSDGERFDQLTRIATGAAPIVIGPRSALFAPLPKLSVVILDECHDASFKQQSGVRYHARDVAMVLARAANAVCLLGSATPGVSDLQLGVLGRATRLDMHHRVHGRPMPIVELVDLKTAERHTDPGQSRPGLLSVTLIDAIRDAVGRGEQAIVLHNRRGFAPTVVCTGCGDPFSCPDCSISLTVHRGQGRMRCHYCDHSEPLEQSCPTCGGHNFIQVGVGTERLENSLKALIAGLRVQRFDRDTTGGRRLTQTLTAFRRRELDVLVGTQMLAKGHDFPMVTVVGVALAETGLRVPDHLAAERTFQLLTQVAGRAGRGDAPGRVIVQTYAPGHPAIVHALGHDHAAFCAWELEQRRVGRYPPFSHLALVETRHKEAKRAGDTLAVVVDFLRAAGLEVRGPVAAGVARIRGVFRFHALVKSPERAPLHRGLAALDRQLRRRLDATVRLVVDVDPMEFG